MRELMIQATPLAGFNRQAITIEVRGQPVTEHFNDQEKLEVAIIADPEPLAEWFAANWWRLRWEPEKENLTAQQQLDWNLSHRLAAAASGYAWPDLLFASDDLSIHCVARKTTGECSPIRFTRQLDEWLDAPLFEAGMDAFINDVATTSAGSNLAQLWHELLDERRHPAASDWRKLEAKAGYDPDEAPDVLIEGLQRYYPMFGKASVEELSSENRGVSALEMAEHLHGSLLASHDTMSPDLGGFQKRAATAITSASSPPWKQAASAAGWARDKLGLTPAQPLTSAQLLEYLDLSERVMSQPRHTPLATAGLKNERDSGAAVLLSPGRVTAQRFALARLLGDYLYTHLQADSQLLSVTHSKTSRQKFQRAFAQELLCPYEGLLETMNTAQPGQESLEKTAEHYQVSPLTVRYTLENRQP